MTVLPMKTLIALPFLACFASTISAPAAALDSTSSRPMRSALRSVVQACVVAQKTFGVSFPCSSVTPPDREDGYALLRSPGQPSEILVVPTQPITGVEDPTFL